MPQGFPVWSLFPWLRVRKERDRRHRTQRGVTVEYPASTFFPSGWAAVQFVNYANGNYALAPTSPYKNAGTDGKDIGADIAGLNAAIASAIAH